MNRIALSLLAAAAWLAAAPSGAQDTIKPTAVLQSPNVIDFGAPLLLSGVESIDVGGQIARYVWTHVEGSGGNMPLNMPFGTLTNTYLVPQPAGNPLALDRHRFQLFVDDNSGNRSNAQEVSVIVADRAPPTAVLDVPKLVMQTQAFQLSGARSIDVGGRIAGYQWSRMAGSADGPMPLNTPIVTTTNVLTIAQSATSYLGIGRHVFRLAVVDDSGNQSKATEAAVEVVAPLPGGKTQ